MHNIQDCAHHDATTTKIVTFQGMNQIMVDDGRRGVGFGCFRGGGEGNSKPTQFIWVTGKTWHSSTSHNLSFFPLFPPLYVFIIRRRRRRRCRRSSNPFWSIFVNQRYRMWYRH